MTSVLRPKNLEGIISATFKIYSMNFLKLLAIVAIVEVSLAAIYVALGAFLDFSFLQDLVIERNIESLSASMIPMGTVLLVVCIVSCVVGTLMNGALIYFAAKHYLQQKISIGKAYDFAWRRLGVMIGAGILAFLAISTIIAICFLVAIFSWIGWALLAVGIPVAIYLAIHWVFIWQTALMEGIGPMSALARSSALVKRNWWRVLGIMLVVSLITIAIVAAAIGVTAAISNTASLDSTLGIIPVIGATIGGILATPIPVIAGTLLYYDLWVRKEDYTFQFL